MHTPTTKSFLRPLDLHFTFLFIFIWTKYKIGWKLCIVLHLIKVVFTTAPGRLEEETALTLDKEPPEKYSPPLVTMMHWRVREAIQDEY